MRFASLIFLLTSVSTPAWAEEPGFFDTAHRQALYESQKKSEWTAIGYTLVFPGVGNFYADQYVTGAVVGMGMVFAITALVFGQTTDQTEWTWLGAGLGGAMYAVGGTTAYLGVQDYNYELRRALKVAEFDRAPGLRLAVSF